jgi:hypothetical protein
MHGTEPPPSRLEPAIRTISPHLPREVMVKLTSFIETKIDQQVPSLSKALRKLHDDWMTEGWALALRATALVIADLIDQGWTVSPDGNRVLFQPPGIQTAGETVDEAKLRLRKSLQIGRDRQLAAPSVHSFIDRFSRPAKNNSHISSALDVVDNGSELAELLQPLSNLTREEALTRLRSIVDPIVEVCDERARCSVTGIRLLDLWRYFRHTWSLEYRSIPGRQLPLLIRNAARPNKPIIGIALLASPVLRTKPRDQWLGWIPEPFIANLRSGKWNSKTALKALSARIDESISQIRWDDLASRADIEDPTERVVIRLEMKGAGANAARERQLQEDYTEALETRGAPRSQIDPAKRGTINIDWLAASEDLLFVRKRAETLAKLLGAKRAFRSLNWRTNGASLLNQLLSTPIGERALSVALQEVRKAGLASQVADLSVCGAVAPYNLLLGGKLVALCVASEEVRHSWRKRYEDQISVISSQMAGRPHYRPADLKILTTTSLYGSGSSQYNRLRLRAAEYPALRSDIVWQELERTAGYGTVHLSGKTVAILREVAEQRYKARRVNNRFGEGTSPRLRQVREGLDVLGIDSNDVLHHATPRLFYICALGPGADKQLLGFTAEKDCVGSSMRAIADAWRSRWLLQRICNPAVLDRLKELGPSTIKNELLPIDDSGQYLFPFDV